jgi:hypothetical protein
MRTPASGMPPSSAADALIWSREFAWTNTLRSTSSGKYDWYVISKKTELMPTTVATT